MTASHPRPAAQPDPVARVELELTVGTEPISGYVRDAAGRRAFTGWVDLVHAIAGAHAVPEDAR